MPYAYLFLNGNNVGYMGSADVPKAFNSKLGRCGGISAARWGQHTIIKLVNSYNSNLMSASEHKLVVMGAKR